MNIALIKNNVCIDIAVFDSLTTAKAFLKNNVWGDSVDDVTELPSGFGIGDSYLDGEWIKAEPIPPTPAEIQESLVAAVQMNLDNKVKERGYDSILSACSYALSPDTVFQAEGIACVNWRDAVWRTCYDILNEVMTGLREIPTVEELIAELPELVWPEG